VRRRCVCVHNAGKLPNNAMMNSTAKGVLNALIAVIEVLHGSRDGIILSMPRLEDRICVAGRKSTWNFRNKYAGQQNLTWVRNFRK
jgi:hypothetical protein